MSWKEEEEKLTYAYFVKPNGEVVNNNGRYSIKQMKILDYCINVLQEAVEL